MSKTSPKPARRGRIPSLFTQKFLTSDVQTLISQQTEAEKTMQLENPPQHGSMTAGEPMYPTAPRIPEVLILDDNIVDRELLKRALLALDVPIAESENVADACHKLKNGAFRLAVVDAYLRDENGVSSLPELVACSPTTQFIALSSAESTRLAVEAVHNGASDFLTKSMGAERIADRLGELLTSKPGGLPRCFGLAGNSAAFEVTCAFVHKHREDDVLIIGEKGTGKTATASVLHRISRRGDERLFIAPCSDVPEEVILEELFGTKGSGLCESGLWHQARCGTLVLDGADCLSDAGVGTILEAMIREPLASRPRLIAVASEASSGPAVARWQSAFEGRTLHVLPLRSRREDIPALVADFLDSLSTKLGCSVRSIPASVLDERASYPWPGNVAELKAFVENYAVQELGHGFDPRVPQNRSSMPSFRDAKEAFEKDYLTRLLAVTGGNISEASRVAGTHRVQIYRFLAKHDVDPLTYKEGTPPELESR